MYNLECYRSIFEETFYMTPVIFLFLKTSSGSDGIQGMTLSWKCATKRQCPNLPSYDAFLMNNARLKTGKRSTVFPYRRSCRKQARGRIVILRHNGKETLLPLSCEREGMRKEAACSRFLRQRLFREAQDILEPYGVDVFGFVKGMAPVLELVQEVSEIGRLVRMGLEQEKRDSKSIPFCDAVSRLLEVKQDVQKRRESTLAQIRYITGRIGKCCPDFAVTLLSQLTTEDCRQMISQTFKPDKQKNDARKILSSIFNFGIKRKWCRDNPAQALDIISIQEHEIHPLIPEEIQALFMACRPPSPEEKAQPKTRKKTVEGARLDLTCCLAPLAIMTFAGIRPQEVTRLTWNDIFLDTPSKVIKVRSMVSKTGGTRQVSICAALESWLRIAPRQEDNSICPPQWPVRWAGLRYRAGWDANGKRWPNDALRHTFASYHVLTHRDIPRLQLEMGHSSSTQIMHRYMNLSGVDQEMAECFWNIVPEEDFYADRNA